MVGELLVGVYIQSRQYHSKVMRAYSKVENIILL